MTERGGRRAGGLPGLSTLAIGLFGLVAFAYLTVPAVDSDYGWHIANGRHLLDGQLFAGVDTYSWTAPGATWIAHEWLTEGLMAFLNDSVGPTANSLLAGTLAALALLLVVARLRGRGFGTPIALIAGAIALLDVGTILSVRPLVVEVIAVALLLWILDVWRAARWSNRRLLVSVGVLFLVWANAHGSFVLGLGILGATWLGLAIERDASARVVLVAGVGAALVTLINPFGFRLLGYVADAVTGSRLGLIEEWAPPNLAASMWWAFVVALGLALLGVARAGAAQVGAARSGAARSGEQRVGAEGVAARFGGAPGGRAVRIDDVVIATALGFEGLQHAYHAGLFGIVAAPVIAGGLRMLTAGLPTRERRPMRIVPVANVAVLGLVAILTGAVAWARVGPPNTAAAVRSEYPIGVLATLDVLAAASPGSLRLLNDYSWGGWLEMVRPDIRVFIDGRSEVYGDAHVQRYATITGLKPGWEAVLAASGANAVLIRSSSGLIPALTARGWSVAYRDPVGTLLFYAPFASTPTAIRQAATPATTCQTEGMAT